MSAGLNDSSKFIQALAEIVQQSMSAPVRALIPPQSIGRLAEPQYAAVASLD
jgi:hypothetical protein